MVGGLAGALAALVGFAGPWGARLLDLDVYRMGADALLSGTDIYTVQESSANLVFTYPVFAAILFIPFAVLPLAVSRFVLTAISLAALFVIVHLTVTWVLRRRGADVTWRSAAGLRWSVPLSLLAVVAHPVWETLTFGQVNLILTALVLIDVLALGSRSRGVLVGIATGIKLVPGIFILYYLVTGQRRAAMTSIVTTLGTILLGLAVQPSAAWAFWTDHALNPDRTGGIAYVTNQSFLGVSARLLRDPHPPRALTLALGAIVVAAALWLARRLAERGETLTTICVVGVCALLASPVSWSHHRVLLIPCLGTLAVWASDTGARWPWIVVGVVAAIGISGPMQFTPKEELRELAHTLPQQLVANIYAALAVAYLVWAAVRSRRAPATTVTASPASAPTP